MHRFIIELHTPSTAQEVLDYFKDNGGHANLINVRPDLDDVAVPAYVTEPYPPEAYEIAVVDPATLLPDCPYCDGSGALSPSEDRAAAIKARHAGWSDDEVNAEVQRQEAEVKAQQGRWEREKERIRSEVGG